MPEVRRISVMPKNAYENHTSTTKLSAKTQENKQLKTKSKGKAGTAKTKKKSKSKKTKTKRKKSKEPTFKQILQKSKKQAFKPKKRLFAAAGNLVSNPGTKTNIAINIISFSLLPLCLYINI